MCGQPGAVRTEALACKRTEAGKGHLKSVSRLMPFEKRRFRGPVTKAVQSGHRLSPGPPGGRQDQHSASRCRRRRGKGALPCKTTWSKSPQGPVSPSDRRAVKGNETRQSSVHELDEWEE